MIKDITPQQFLEQMETGFLELQGQVGKYVVGRRPYVKVIGETRPRSFEIVRAEIPASWL